MHEPLKIIFAGTPYFAAAALQGLLSSEYQVVAVYAQPDRPAGRGRKVVFGPVKQLALAHSIPVRQPKSLKDRTEQVALAALQADLMVVAAYGLLLPQNVLEAPRLGCINIHASLLPRWRGAAPIQRAILAGDEESGVTIMQMEAGLDTGPMLYKLRCPIQPDDTGGTLHDRLAGLGAQALLEVLPGLAAGTLRAEPQDDALANYAHKLEKQESDIDWQQAAQQIDRQIRAFNPWPVAQTGYQGEVMRIWEAQVVEDGVSTAPGTIVAAGKTGIEVATGRGRLRILRLQMPGKRAMAAVDFLNAHSVDGVVLG
jgi:methionyl-tRNA formyltransferase